MVPTQQQILDALEKFFQEDFDLAEDAGYELSMGASDDGTKIYVDVTAEEPDRPDIKVYPRKQSDGSWEFGVDMEFPTFNLDKISGTAEELIEGWRSAAELADDLASVKFVYTEWAE